MTVLKASPGTCAVKLYTVDGEERLVLDGVTEEKATSEMRRRNAARKNPTDDLCVVIADTGLGTGPRVVEQGFDLERLRRQKAREQ